MFSSQSIQGLKEYVLWFLRGHLTRGIELTMPFCRTTPTLSRASVRHMAIITTVFVLIHGAMLVFGAFNPQSFLAGDRSNGRLKTIQSVFLSAEVGSIAQTGTGQFDGQQTEGNPSLKHTGYSLIDRVLESGHPGDYIFHGVLYELGGRHAVVAFQLCLLIVSVACLYLLATFLGRSAGFALSVAIVYMVLPGSLIQPHQLTSEAIFNPLVLISFFLIVARVERIYSSRAMVLGLCLLSLAIFVRPQLILFPILLLLILAVHFRHSWRPAMLAILPICFALPMAWGLFAYYQTGEFGLGGKGHGPGIAFYKTVKRMAVIDGFEIDLSSSGEKKLSIDEFTRYVLDHPVTFVKLKMTEAFNLVANPGIYSVVAHHLGLLRGGGDKMYWKKLRDQEGLTGMFSEIFRRGPALILAIFGSAIAWGLVLVGAVAGGIAFWRDGTVTNATKTILLSYLFYGMLIVLVSSEVRWSHRTPVEFVIVLLFAAGLEHLVRRRKR